MNQLSNNVRLIGHAGMNPEIKATTNGTKYAKFALATHEVYKDKAGERKVETVWHNLILWGKEANIAEKLIQKGTKIAIEGKISNRTYTSTTGMKKFLSQVVVSDLMLVSKAA